MTLQNDFKNSDNVAHSVLLYLLFSQLCLIRLYIFTAILCVYNHVHEGNWEHNGPVFHILSVITGGVHNSDALPFLPTDTVQVS